MKWLLCTVLAVGMLAGCRSNVTPEQQAKDLEITATAKSKMASDLGLQTVTNVTVDTTNGIVTLSGTVKDADSKSRAAGIVRALPHVTSVNNNLQIASGT